MDCSTRRDFGALSEPAPAPEVTGTLGDGRRRRGKSRLRAYDRLADLLAYELDVARSFGLLGLRLT
jgi:hypothetical protein